MRHSELVRISRFHQEITHPREPTMRVKIEEVGVGQHPSEKVVRNETTEGPEQLVVNARTNERQTLTVG